MTTQALKILIEEGLDAMNIDIKGDKEVVSRYCEANVEKVWRNARNSFFALILAKISESFP